MGDNPTYMEGGDKMDGDKPYEVDGANVVVIPIGKEGAAALKAVEADYARSKGSAGDQQPAAEPAEVDIAAFAEAAGKTIDTFFA